MKVTAITGSPRKKGNTDILVGKILEGAESIGAETELYNVTDMEVKGCTGCYSCKGTGICVIKDDMQILYKKLHESDVIVLGSPVYFFQMSSQLKAFIDRLVAVLKPDFTCRLEKGKKVIFAYTQGFPKTDRFEDYFKMTAEIFTFLGFEVLDTVVAGGLTSPGDVNEQKDVLEKAFETGKKLGEVVSVN